MSTMLSLLILCLIPVSSLACDELSPTHHDSSYSYDGYEGDYEGSHEIADVDPLLQALEQNGDALPVLFGSSEKAESEICERIAYQFANYWELDQAYYSIETALNKSEGINTTTRWQIEDILSVIHSKAMSYANANSTLLYSLQKSRQVIDCAVGRSTRNSHFAVLEQEISTHPSSYCRRNVLSLWWDLMEADTSNKNCSLREKLTAIVEIDELYCCSNKGLCCGAISEDSTRYNLAISLLNSEHIKTIVRKNYVHIHEHSEAENERFQLKVDLLLALSNPKALSVLKQLVCKITSPPVCRLYKTAICKNFDYFTLTELTEMIEKSSNNFIPNQAEDVVTLLEVQRKLGEVSNGLTNLNSPRTNTFEVRAAKKMLDYYFGIVDKAIGNSSVDVWKHFSDTSVILQFEEILAASDVFAGNTSDKILMNGDKEAELHKDTLDISMKHVSAMEDIPQESVEFNFGNAQIWTENFLDVEKNDSELNLVAIYYKSMHEILNAISGRTNGTMAGVSTRTNLTLIGSGGIISLTARTKEKQKKVVPVIYKIDFEGDDLFVGENNEIVRRCISCRYLDLPSKEWISDGCYVREASDDGVTCHCNHTTNFAAFMSPFVPVEFTESQNLWLNIIEYIGSIISVICLLMSFVVFCLVRHKIRHDRLRAHCNLVVALFFVHLIQLVADAAVRDTTLCTVVAITTHYFLLAAFMWMLVEGIFLYFYVVQVFMLSNIASRKWMYIVGWLVPLAIVGISAGYGLPNNLYLEEVKPLTEFSCKEGQYLYPPLKNEMEYSSCWLSKSSGMIWAFIGPALAVITCNIIILGKVVSVIVKLSKRAKKMKAFASSPTYSNRTCKSKSQSSKTDSSSKPMLKSSHIEMSVVSENSTELNGDSLHGIVESHHPNSSTSPVYTKRPQHFRSKQDSVSDQLENSSMNDVKTAVKGASVLLPILGIPWILGTFGSGFVTSLLFVILNSFQGLAIFLIYCVFNEEVSREFRRYIATNWLNDSSHRRSRISSASSNKSIFHRGAVGKRKRISTVTTISRSNVDM